MTAQTSGKRRPQRGGGFAHEPALRALSAFAPGQSPLPFAGSEGYVVDRGACQAALQGRRVAIRPLFKVPWRARFWGRRGERPYFTRPQEIKSTGGASGSSSIRGAAGRQPGLGRVLHSVSARGVTADSTTLVHKDPFRSPRGGLA